MKNRIPISDARRRLPGLVKQLLREPGTIYTITVRNEPVAELHAAAPSAEPGLAARTLLDLMAKLPKPRGKAFANVASHTKEHLYGKDGVVK